MSYRLEPQQPVSQNIKHIAASQIEEVLESFGGKPASAKAIHETRKAVKRLRALLSLARPAIASDDLSRERDRLRAIAHSLAGARDTHVMMETATALQGRGLPRECRAASRTLVALLAKKREAAGGEKLAQPASLPLHTLQEALDAMRALPVKDVTFADVVACFAETYRRGRKLHATVLKPDADDEQVHELRKQVQQHWRHLQLFTNAWPKALRPSIALASELSETLGQDHDIAVLAAFSRHASTGPGDAKGFDAYAAFCALEQARLRRHAGVLGRRLYAEKPKAIRRRLAAYWQTADELGKAGQPSPGAKIIAIKR